jgi:hypothetical protein
MIYVASPYSHPDPEICNNNFKEVTKFVSNLCSQGIVAFSPITYGHTLIGFHELPSNWEYWEDFCFTFLKKCDKMIVYMMPGWELSKGVKEEIKFADNHKIKIVFEKYIK